MRVIRQATTTTALLLAALVPVTAAVAPDRAARPVPVAVAQPVLAPVPWHPARASMLPESALIGLVGIGLIGVAAVMRRTGV